MWKGKKKEAPVEDKAARMRTSRANDIAVACLVSSRANGDYCHPERSEGSYCAVALC